MAPQDTTSNSSSSTETAQKPKFLSTGNKKLDELLGGSGIRIPEKGDSPIILICGTAGTGKTTLALQIATSFAESGIGAGRPDYVNGKTVCFYSLEQGYEALLHVKNSFGFGPAKDSQQDENFLDMSAKGKLKEGAVNCCRLQPMSVTATELPKVFEQRLAQLKHVLESRKETGGMVVFIDSLNALTAAPLTRADIQNLFQLFRHAKVPLVITSEDASESRTITETAQFQADVVIKLTKYEKDYVQYYLEITKSRLSRQTYGRHLYKIRTEGRTDSDGQKPGIVVYPSIHAALTRAKEKRAEGGILLSPDPPQYCLTEEEGRDASQLPRVNQNRSKPREDLKTPDIGWIMQKSVKPGACFAILGAPGTHRLALGMNLATGRLEGVGTNLLILSFGETAPIDFSGVAWFNEREAFKGLKEDSGSGPGKAQQGRRKWWTNRYSTTKGAGDNVAGDGGKVTVLTFELGELTPEECFYAVQRELDDAEEKKTPYTAVLVIDTDEIATGFPLLAANKLFIPSLIELLQLYELVSVWIGHKEQGEAMRDLELAISARSDYRIHLAHSPENRELPQKIRESYAAGARGDGIEQAVWLVIDNVTGKDYNRKPRWLWVDNKVLHCSSYKQYCRSVPGNDEAEHLRHDRLLSRMHWRSLRSY